MDLCADALVVMARCLLLDTDTDTDTDEFVRNSFYGNLTRSWRLGYREKKVFTTA